MPSSSKLSKSFESSESSESSESFKVSTCSGYSKCSGDTIFHLVSPDACKQLLDERIKRIIELITQLIQPNDFSPDEFASKTQELLGLVKIIKKYKDDTTELQNKINEVFPDNPKIDYLCEQFKSHYH